MCVHRSRLLFSSRLLESRRGALRLLRLLFCFLSLLALLLAASREKSCIFLAFPPPPPSPPLLCSLAHCFSCTFVLGFALFCCSRFALPLATALFLPYIVSHYSLNDNAVPHARPVPLSNPTDVLHERRYVQFPTA